MQRFDKPSTACLTGEALQSRMSKIPYARGGIFGGSPVDNVLNVCTEFLVGFYRLSLDDNAALCKLSFTWVGIIKDCEFTS